jgi:hypothetical protein
MGRARRTFWLSRLSSIAVLLMTASSVWAQTDSTKNQLDIGLNFMTHGEIRSGGLPRSFDEDVTIEDRANFVMGRTRLWAEYRRSGLEARVMAQNTAVWGMRNNTAITLYEAWVKLKARNGMFAQIGRIPLAYDDERIIGPDDWAMAALSHDVLRLGYEGHGHKVHALLAYNQNAENLNTGTYYENGAQPYKTMQTLWYHYDIPKFPFGASLLFMNIGMQSGTKGVDPHTEYQQMLGTRLLYHPKHLDLEGSYYRQMGKDEYATKIEAWMASVKATVKPTDNYGFSVGYDYLSGDDYVPVIGPGTIGLPYHAVIKGFTPVYGSHHQFYGVMDYFYQSAYSQGFTPGLQNAFIGGYWKPFTPLTCRAAYHYMATATTLKNLNKTLGHDIELEAKYQFTKDISLSAGFTFMVGTETMDRLKQGTGDKYVRWGWFSLNISPTLFRIW